MPPVSVTVYTRDDCDRCEDAVETIETVADEEGIDVDLSLVNVDDDPALREEYGERVPYVLLNDRPAFKYSVQPGPARSKLRALADDSE